MSPSLRSFAFGLAGSLLGFALVLAVFEWAVLAPREQRQRVALAAELEAAAERVEADRMRSASAVGKALEDSVDRSIEQVRSAVEEEAHLNGLRAAVGEGLIRATSLKVVLVEYYLSSNRWPESAEQAGLPAAESFQSANLNGISLGSEGEIRIDYADSVQAGASLSLLPSVNATTGEVLWACLSQGFVDLRLPPLSCQAKPSER